MPRKRVGIDRLEITVPGGVADDRHNNDQSDKCGRNADQQGHDYNREPDDHCTLVAKHGIY
jgi:hypothetical protein